MPEQMKVLAFLASSLSNPDRAQWLASSSEPVACQLQ
jgi:hypothetical protein